MTEDQKTQCSPKKIYRRIFAFLHLLGQWQIYKLQRFTILIVQYLLIQFHRLQSRSTDIQNTYSEVEHYGKHILDLIQSPETVDSCDEYIGQSTCTHNFTNHNIGAFINIYVNYNFDLHILSCLRFNVSRSTLFSDYNKSLECNFFLFNRGLGLSVRLGRFLMCYSVYYGSVLVFLY